MINRFPGVKLEFVIHKNFALKVGLDRFWAKYTKVGKLENFVYSLADMPWYKPLAGRQYGQKYLQCNNDETQPKFFLRVSVTVANLRNVRKCLLRYANRTGYMFIIHHPTRKAGGGGHDGTLLRWTNAYVASDSSLIPNLTPRHFSPALMPIPPGQPRCDKPPVFIVQGDIERRNLEEINWMLATTEQFSLRVMTRQRNTLWNDSRIEYHLNLPMTEFHEAFQTAAFILPLISSNSKKTFTYFHGRSTSTIPYGVHFQLSFVADIHVRDAFGAAFSGTHAGPAIKHYWHEGNANSFLTSFR